MQPTTTIAPGVISALMRREIEEVIDPYDVDRWLDTPNEYLGGQPPRAFLTDSTLDPDQHTHREQAVRDLLTLLKYGTPA